MSGGSGSGCPHVPERQPLAPKAQPTAAMRAHSAYGVARRGNPIVSLPAGILALALGLPGLAQSRFEFTQAQMGTWARIVLHAPDEVAARAAARAGFERIAAIDALASDYRPESELMRLCALAGTGPVAASPELFLLLDASTMLCAQTGGAFDASAGPLVVLWRDARRAGRLPDPDDIDAARSSVGCDLVSLDAGAMTVRLERPGMLLDLGGIAKGYAADQALGAMRALGVTRCLVAISGDIAAGDPPPDEPGWTIEVDLGDGPVGTIVIARQAVSTSGDESQFIEVGGERYSHVLDPRTGLGTTSRAAACVVAPQGMWADALATALCVVGVDEAPGLLARHAGARAIVRDRSDDGMERVFVSAGFDLATSAPKPE
jgi:thiamine biosynthesis lipoprotein